MSWFDYCEYDDEYEDACADEFAGYYTKKRYNQGKHTHSASYEKHSITCKRCGVGNLTWEQDDDNDHRWRLCDKAGWHNCVTNKNTIPQDIIAQGIAELKQRKKLTEDQNNNISLCKDYYCNKKGDITVTDMVELIAFAKQQCFVHDDQPTTLCNWLVLRAYDSRFCPEQAMAYRLAAMIISRVDISHYE